jgi:heme exporter protein B
MQTNFLKAAAAIAWKDLKIEWRSRDLVLAMVLFAALAVMIFAFALELDQGAQASVVGGVFWVTVDFAGMLGLGRSLAAEQDRGSFDGLLLAPVDRAALYFGKMAGNLLFMLIVAALLIALLTVFFGVSLFDPLLIGVALLGTLGFSAVGTLLASMSVKTRARETMLPVLLLPVALPLVIAAVRATNAILDGLPFDLWRIWPVLLITMDVIYLAGAALLFDFIVEE